MAEIKNSFHESILNGLEAGRLDEGHDFVFNIKKNAIADLFIAMLRKVLNKSKYSIRIRGSQADRKRKRDSGLHVTDTHVPLEHADRYRIYIDGIKDDEATKALKILSLSLSLSKSNANLLTAELKIESLKRDLNNSLQNNTELLFQIGELKSRLEALIPKSQPQNFAVTFISDIGNEYSQILAFRRGYSWASEAGNSRVVSHPHKHLIFSFDDGKYNIYHGNDLQDANVRTVFDLATCTGVEDYAAHLTANAHFQMTKEEVKEIKLGNKLMCVKMIKDRTGLGLKESKAIADSYQNYNPELFNYKKF